ncbi:ABC transporter substrate-binding protein [Ruminococcus sp.]|uniref:ABC transporter substrate-binding protein n=1 Tax=Ruminococcus sp. TaxID=41978 RepID=UPI0025DA61F3|nr:ABC transporter substrate-binding protein [Ruminococcus sp.]MCR4638617.1 ABC transporter substrate-binding protein [Ruminococcus sp.]
MKKKFFAGLLAAVMLTAGTSGCGSQSAEKSGNGEYVLKIGEAQGALCHAPLQIAMEKGFLDNEGIKWERVDFGKADIQAALGAGTIDCGFGLVGKFIQPIDNGLNMVITAGMHTGCTKLLVKKDSGIKSVSDLKGKKIGVSSLAGSEAVTAKRLLFSNGFDISADSSDIEFLVYSTADQPIALQNGAVDAICTMDPVATQAEKEYDLLPLMDTAKTEPYASEYCCVTFVSTELAEKHPDVAAKFTDACLKASAWVAANPEEAAKIQVEKEYVSGNADDNAEILKTYEFRPSVQGGYDALVNVANELKAIGLINENTDTDDLVKRSFKKFDGVPDSYEADGDNFNAVQG